MRRAVLCWMLVAAGGCDTPAQAAAGISTLPTASESASAPEPVEDESASAPALRSAGPLVVAPAVRNDGVGKYGWAADGKSFALCIEGRCTFTFVDGKAETREGAEARARLEADGIAPGSGQWRHGKDVELTWEAADDRARLALGAALRTGETVADLVWMDFDPDFGEDVEIYAEVVSVAPEGDRLAVVGHAREGSKHEFKTILLYSDDIAARAHTRAGHDYLEGERFEQAVASFERAVAAHPDGWEYRYDLACGRARSGTGDVRRPLQRAIDLGGAKVRSKAQRDSALASVKRTPWFKALVSD